MSTPAGVETRGPAIVAVAVVFPILSSIFVGLRVYTRIRITNFFGIDDWCAIATLCSAIVYSACLGVWTTHGGGMHQYDMTDAIMEEYYKWLLIASEFYVTSLLGYKTAILLLYLRIFSAHDKFRIACYIVITFNTGYLLANLFLQIFSCTPIPKFFEPDLPGRCVSLTPPDIAFGAMLMASDFAIAILPIPVVWSLHMSRRDKILVSLVFLAGLLAFIMATTRWILAVIDLNAADRTWLAGMAFLFSIIEVNTGIICGCAPTLKPLFKFARQYSSHRKTSADAKHLKKQSSDDTGFSHGAENVTERNLRVPPATMNLSTTKSMTWDESPGSTPSSNVAISKATIARPSIAEALPEELAFSADRLHLPREGTREQPDLRRQSEFHEIGSGWIQDIGTAHTRDSEVV